MSFWDGVQERALLDALDACDRLAPRLLDMLGRHEHAASLARVDWDGPHHERLEDEVLVVRHTLIDGQVWVRHLRHELLLAYQAVQVAKRARLEGVVPIAAVHS